MSSGFFDEASFAKPPPTPTQPRCGTCGLYKSCKSPKMELSGDGRKGILIVAEAPGADEDERGTQLVGKSGRLLRDELDELGIDLDRDCWKTNAIICRPKDNRTPSDAEIEYCRPNVLNAITELKPRTIILLGDSAVKALIGWLWRESPGSIGRWIGWRIPDQRLNAWICPMWHPSYLLRPEKQYVAADPRLVIWREHLAAAVGLNKRPWKTVPDWQSDVRVEMDDVIAAEELDGIVKWAKDRCIAVDYETNMLKPDGPDARIVSCAVAYGYSTGPTGVISYPWTKATAAATGRLLRSPIPKIIANQQFEIRWTLKEFGHGIDNIVWDTMQNAHIMDNRKGRVTSVKFQSYVLLGQSPWDEHIKPFLKAKYSNVPNRIHQIKIEDLLLYGGLDALLEYRLAIRQRKLMGTTVI